MSNTKKIQKPVINYEDKTIEMTVRFSEAARRYGTQQYKILKGMMADLPDYAPTIKHTKKASPDNKGLTYANMEKYIKAIDAERAEESGTENKHTAMKEYLKQRKKAKGEPTSADGYQLMCKWFAKKYPGYTINKRKAEKNAAEQEDETPAPASAIAKDLMMNTDNTNEAD